MFSANQKAIINNGSDRYKVSFFYDFYLNGSGNPPSIKWTTNDYDYNGYQAENFVLANGSMTAKTDLSDVTCSLELSGNISVLSAFENSRGAKVAISMGISDGTTIEVSEIFSGFIAKYEIKRNKSDVKLLLDLTDKISGIGNQSARVLSMNAQYNIGNDECLKNMITSKDAVFWGKGL